MQFETEAISHQNDSCCASACLVSSVWLLPARFTNTCRTWNDDCCCRRMDCRVWVEWGSAGLLDESFVFLLIDADIVSCLLLLHFKIDPLNWHVPSLHNTVRHWCVHSPSLCISRSYGFLSCGFLLFMSLDNPSRCSGPIICPLCLIWPLLPPLQLHPAGLPASPVLLHPLKPPSFLLFPFPLHTCFYSIPLLLCLPSSSFHFVPPPQLTVL